MLSFANLYRLQQREAQRQAAARRRKILAVRRIQAWIRRRAKADRQAQIAALALPWGALGWRAMDNREQHAVLYLVRWSDQP